MLNKPIDTSLLPASHDTISTTFYFSDCLLQIHALYSTTCVADIYHLSSDQRSQLAEAWHALINLVSTCIMFTGINQPIVALSEPVVELVLTNRLRGHVTVVRQTTRTVVASTTCTYKDK